MVEMIRARTLPEQIADALADDILSGALGAGEKISEQQVADRFGVSRGPVRDAIDLLERTGLVVNKPRVSARVLAVTAESIRERHDIQRSLFQVGARYAARKATTQTMPELNERLAVLQSSLGESDIDAGEYLNASYQMYDAMMRLARSRQLSSLVYQVSGGVLLQMYMYRHGKSVLSPDWARRHVAQWAKVVEAIAANDEERAVTEMDGVSQFVWELIGPNRM